MRTLSFLFFVFMILRLPAQENVKLVSWNVGQCDENSDPYRLVNRISAIGFTGNELHMTIGFRDNCCPHFNPAIRYSGDTLFIQTYVWDGKSEGSFAMCGCDCCFSMDFVISGLSDTSFVTIFKNRRVYYSTEPYRTFPIKFEVVNGDTVNRTNKHGEHIGLWFEYYPGGTQRSETSYPMSYTSIHTEYVWRMSWYENGHQQEWDNHDTMKLWYENGQLKYFKTTKADDGDKVKSELKYYQNGQLKEKTEERWIAEEHIVYDSCSGYQPVITEVYESYYENGQVHKLSDNDTMKCWYPDGKIEYIATGDSTIHYYPSGKVMRRNRSWRTRVPEVDNCLSHFLEITYYENGMIQSVRLVRDESEGQGAYTTSYYDWKWDEQGKITAQPKNWTGSVPTFTEQ